MGHEYFQEFVTLALIHFLAVIVPGPDFVITVRQSIKYGRLHGILTAMGIGSGLSVHVIYTILGVSALMQTSPVVLASVKILGISYLVYLGISLCFSKSTGKLFEFELDKEIAMQQSATKAFWIGFLTNATNPKATLFFVAVMTSVVSAETPIMIQVYYGIWMCFVNAMWFILVSLLFSSTFLRSWFNNKVQIVERTLGALLLIFATRLVLL